MIGIVEKPLGDETEAAWNHLFATINRVIAATSNKKQIAYTHVEATPISEAEIKQSYHFLQCGGEIQNKAPLERLFYVLWQDEAKAAVEAFWQRPELNVVHLARFLYLIGSIRPKGDRQVISYGHWLEQLLPVFRKSRPQIGLKELSEGIATVGYSANRLGAALLTNYQEPALPFGLEPEKIWPFWAERIDFLKQAINPIKPLSKHDYMGRWEQKKERKNAFHALATFPQPPTEMVPILWELALGPKTERPVAQRCLRNVPDKVPKLIEALSASKAETRAAAAEWLAKLRVEEAVDPLLRAFETEKNDVTKGAFMAAMESLGISADQFLDRAGLIKDASKGLAKGIPEALQSFPFPQMPSVHWNDNGKLVEPEILQWWLVQAFKLKNPEPGVLLRRYCQSFNPDEREALGQFILEAWIGEDTAPIPQQEAEQQAQQHAQQMHHWASYMHQQGQQNPGLGTPSAQPPKSVEAYYTEALPQFLRQPKGSAIATKGILAVAGACAGGGAVPVVNRYLKDWYGMRAAQCRALLQMLVWVDHPSATQLLLAVGSRFRTKGIQEEATKQAQALADRKGWTMAELADRTIPTAGMDETGALRLDYGSRHFEARLSKKLEFILCDASGEAIKNLPEPRKDDDEAKAASAKKLLSGAKKELKTILQLQRERFYEAMCTQRQWRFDDWNLYLNQHPIVRHYCQRLVWGVCKGEEIGQAFRPLPDGSLTDANDESVEIGPESFIRLAHGCLVSPELSNLWLQHLADYNVEPLFPQFGKEPFSLTDETKHTEEIRNYEGHLIEAFKLRGRCNKLGYTRGQAQDGGWFYEYHKRFPTLGIEALLEFSGNGLPEENRTVALKDLHFCRLAESPEQNFSPAGKLVLSEVPSVLLVECWNDLRQIAADGSGFDPDWENKVH